MPKKSKYMTIAWIIEQLKEYPPEAKVVFDTAGRADLKWFSDYEHDGIIRIDIGGDEDV